MRINKFPLISFKAFTLAEVIIVIGIIGIIAEISIPTLIADFQREISANRLKEDYSIITQAFKLAEIDNGPSKDWADWNDSYIILKDYLAPNLKYSKIYNKADAPTAFKTMCFDSVEQNPVKYINNAQYGWSDKTYISSPFSQNVTSSIKLENGTCIGLNGNAESITYPYEIFIDINGSAKGPNRAGFDLFFFTFVDGKIMPHGYNWLYSSITSNSINNSCSNSPSYTGGLVCAARIIVYDNWQIKYKY